MDWLRRDPDLRGRLRLSASQGLPDAMGASSDLLLQLGVATVGAGAIWAALARSISTWLVQRVSSSASNSQLPTRAAASIWSVMSATASYREMTSWLFI